MILLVHILLGALIGKEINNPILAIILAFLCHYLLDLIPHVEYPTKHAYVKDWKKLWPDFLKILLDFSFGILSVFLISSNQPIIYICVFFAILPDGIFLVDKIVKFGFIKKLNDFHGKKVHFLKDKKISNFWRISSQVAVALICLFFLKF